MEHSSLVGLDRLVTYENEKEREPAVMHVDVDVVVVALPQLAKLLQHSKPTNKLGATETILSL